MSESQARFFVPTFPLFMVMKQIGTYPDGRPAYTLPWTYKIGIGDCLVEAIMVFRTQLDATARVRHDDVPLEIRDGFAFPYANALHFAGAIEKVNEIERSIRYITINAQRGLPAEVYPISEVVQQLRGQNG